MSNKGGKVVVVLICGFVRIKVEGLHVLFYISVSMVRSLLKVVRNRRKIRHIVKVG